MLKKLHLYAVACCNIGKCRENNEDNLLFDRKILKEVHKGASILKQSADLLNAPQYFGIFDGMGGYSLGEKASYIMAYNIQKLSVLSEVDAEKNDIAENLKRTCMESNHQICEIQKQTNLTLGTTASMLCFYRDKVYICNIGDSPMFRVRNGKIESIYEEHTDRKMMELLLGVQKCRGRKFSLTQHIGIPEEEMLIEPYLNDLHLREDDIYLMCSDGLTDMVSMDDLEILLHRETEIEALMSQLLEKALKNGGKDNITIICIKIGK